jgi:WD40 repeat protein/serine/threonine protein kinase
MNTSARITQTDDIRVVQAVHDYLAKREGGQKVDRQQFLACYSEIADALNECLNALDLIEDFLPHFTDGSQALDHELNHGDEQAAGFRSLQLGDYQIIRRIGHGGMGVVYEARQLSLQRPVALKILPLAGVLDPRALKRFQTEAIAAASLDHPHIVSIYSVGCERGIHYFAMQYVAGWSLAELIRPQGDSLPATSHRQSDGMPAAGNSFLDSSRQSPAGDTSPLAALSTERDDRRDNYCRTCARLILQAAEALEYAHEMGVVHRDVKPSNLLANEQGKVWIGDFGLAMIRGDAAVTMTGDLVGTLRYMSPEQASGQRRVLDHRTDIYSLGISLYELLARQPAFAAEDRQTLIRAILESHPIPLRKINASIPRDIETIVQKAAEKHPDSRYQTAQDMADDLRRFLEHRPILARRVRWPQRCWRWACRNRALAALLLTAASLLLFLAIAGPWAARREAILRREVERRNYVLATSTAYAAFEQGNLVRARRLLAQYLPERIAQRGASDCRGFEWHYLWSQLDFIEANPTVNHAAPVTDIALSPDGRTLATAGEDGNVKLWALLPGQQRLVRVLRVDPAGVNCIALFPNGETLVAGGRSSVTLWDVATGSRQREFGTEELVSDVTVSPDGSTVAWSTWNQVDRANLCVWSVGTSEVFTVSDQMAEIRSVAFSPDSLRLASASSDRTARLWDLKSTPAGSIRVEERQVFTHRNLLFAVAFSPDGKYLAAGGYNYETRLWDLETGKLVTALQAVGHSVTSLAFSADGHVLVTGGRDNCASVWDWRAGKRSRVVRGHSSDVSSVALSRDGLLLATGSRDGTAKLWPISVIEEEASHGAYRTLITFVPGRPHLIAGNCYWATTGLKLESHHRARVYDLRTGEAHPLGPAGSSIRAIVTAARNNPFLLGTDLLATAGRRANESSDEVCLWNVRTGQMLTRIDVPGATMINRLTFSPDGRHLVIATENGQLIAWNLATGKASWEVDVGSQIFALACSPDGSELWIGVFRLFVPDRQWRGGDIQRRLAATGQLLTTLHGHNDVVTSIAFSPDGKHVATSSLDKTIRIWDTAGGTTQRTLSGHTMWVFAVAYSPDGNRLASGSADGTVRLWDAQSGDELATLGCHLGVDSVAFSTEGRTLAAGHTDTSVSVWHDDFERQPWPQRLR